MPIALDWEKSGVPSKIKAHVHASEINHDHLKNVLSNEHLPHTQNIKFRGLYSITGEANLSASGTLSLVNDKSSPGAFQFYGTNASGVRRWRFDKDYYIYNEIEDALKFPEYLAIWPQIGDSDVLANRKVATFSEGLERCETSATSFVRIGTPQKHMYFLNDFTVSTAGHIHFWHEHYVSSGITNTIENDVGGHVGVLYIKLTDLYGSRYSIMGSSESICIGDGNGKYWIDAIVKCPSPQTATQTYSVVLGFWCRSYDLVEVIPPLTYWDGVVAIYSWQTRNRWFLATKKTRYGTGTKCATKASSKVISATRWYNIKVVVEDGHKLAKLYIDDSLEATISRFIYAATPTARMTELCPRFQFFQQSGKRTPELYLDALAFGAYFKNGRPK